MNGFLCIINLTKSNLNHLRIASLINPNVDRTTPPGRDNGALCKGTLQPLPARPGIQVHP